MSVLIWDKAGIERSTLQWNSERYRHTHTRAKTLSHTIETLKSKHTHKKTPDIYGKHGSREKVKTHAEDLQVDATYLCVCARRCDRPRLRNARMIAASVPLCAFQSLAVFLMGGKKDNATAERGVRAEQGRVSQES